MKVTPLEIRQKTFEKGFRGYEKEEVEAYLLTLSVEWEKLAEENRDFKSKVQFLEKEVQKMREVETSLYKTLKTAEDTGSNMVEQANKTSELILKESQMNADAILNDAKYQAKNIMEEAEAKVRNLSEEAKDFVKISRREIHEIEGIKENLLIELKSIAGDVIEKVNKIHAKSKKFAVVEKSVSATFENKTGEASQDLFQSNKPSESRVKNDSFFDQL